jgi:hypothetical protein
MRKLWYRRRAISTMIGGTIVLAILLTAIAAMILVSQQYDTYQSTANQMGQMDNDRFSENVAPINLTLTQSGPPLYWYALNVSNYGIGTQVVRIYISSTKNSNVCYPAPCILNPADTPTANTFQRSGRYLNPGEYYHIIVIWLPNSLLNEIGGNTFLIVTSRARVFSFQWPPAQAGTAFPGAGWGGTGINIGPLVIRYESVLLTYSSDITHTPSLPNDGGWDLPRGSPTKFLILFVKIASQGGKNVTLSKQSLIQVSQYANPGASGTSVYYLVAPMATTLCNTVFRANPLNQGFSGVLCGTQTDGSGKTIGRGSIDGGNQYPGSGGAVQSYSLGSQPYIIPPSPYGDGICCGPAIYLLFSSKTAGGTNANGPLGGSGQNTIYYSFLNIIYQYDDGSGQGPTSYTFGVNIPFVEICGGTDPGNYLVDCPT